MQRGLLTTFIRQLEQELELPQLAAFDTDQACTLHFPSLVQVKIHAIERGWSFSASLGACPLHNREQFFCQALLANLLGGGTGGGVLALDNMAKEVLFLKLLTDPFNYGQFKEALEDFLNYAQLWQEKIKAA